METNFSANVQAEKMALLIEHWLNNPLSRALLSFCTAHDKYGSRMENALKSYAGLKVKTGLRGKIANKIVSASLDFICSKLDANGKHELREALKEGYWRKGLASVLEGIAWKGVKKPFIAAAPFLVVWNFTNACNLHCKHCYQNAGKRAGDELTTEEALHAVDVLADAGVAYIAFSGGEPLAREDFFKIAKHVVERDMAFAVATNGTLLSEKNAKKLKDLGCSYVQVSLDGKKETHNAFRGTNYFDRTVQGIKNAKKAGVTVGIAMCVTKFNYNEIDYMIDFAEKLNADIFMHYNFIPTGRGKHIIAADLTTEMREKLLHKLASETGKRKISILSTAPQFARVCTDYNATSLTHFDVFSTRPEFGEKVAFLADFVGGCGAARLYCALQPNGDVTPCVFLPIKVGNIRKDDFSYIWKNSAIFETIRNRAEFEEHCKICEFRNRCGGCRARAYAYMQNLQQADPGCINNKELFYKLAKQN